MSSLPAMARRKQKSRELLTVMLLLVVVAIALLAAAVAVGGLGFAAMGASPTQQHTRLANAPRDLPPYQVLDFTPVGAHTAWTVTSGNQLRNPPQSVQRSTDGGAHWSDVTPPGLSRAGRFTTITAVDFANRMRAWIAYGPPEGRQTLLTSADGGRIWTRAGLAPSCQLQFVNPSDGWCVAIGGAAGSEFVAIYRTTTAGRTWREVSHNALPGEKSTPDPIPFGCDKRVAFSSPTDGFATLFCAGGNGYVYASTDSGARWHRQLSVPTPAGGSSGAEFTTVVASGDDAAAGFTVQGYKTTPTSSVVYHSTDGGARWIKIRPPGRPRGYDVDILTPSVWRLVAGRTVLSTDDAGRSWTHITANVALSQDVLFTTTNVGWDVAAASYGTSDNVLHTTDGGRHWTTIHVAH